MVEETKIYQQGYQGAYTEILQKCLEVLGLYSPEAAQLIWIVERENAILQLRRLCADFGDNEWNEDDVTLGEIIRRHLADYLYEAQTTHMIVTEEIARIIVSMNDVCLGEGIGPDATALMEFIEEHFPGLIEE